jgi:hypothetical protein
VLFDLVEHEGLVLGGSTGINVAGAIKLARELGPGHTIVTILCDDYGNRYQSKLFNPEFLREEGPAGAALGIGDAAAPTDLQPCGGTHVRNTAEIGALAIAKIENKGKQNRRVVITFAGEA